MMASHHQSLIAKAHRYCEEPGRLVLVASEPFEVQVHGDNAEHRLTLREQKLTCDCEGFARDGGMCAHVLAVAHHYRDQLPPDAAPWPPASPVFAD